VDQKRTNDGHRAMLHLVPHDNSWKC